MNKGFWEKLKKSTRAGRPIMALAPMANVTDAAFRRIIAKYGKPDVTYTEFVSCEGLLSKGRKKLLDDLIFSESERPIVAQVFGSKPEQFCECAKLIKKLGFDGIDINMGCPDKSIEKQCSGAAMMKDPKLAREIIRAAKEGGEGLPISVKTRIGYNPPAPQGFGQTSKNKNYLLDEKWIRALLEEDLTALTVHLRTRKEMSDVPAHWNLMKRIVEIRNEMTSADGGARNKVLIIGNGDILNLEDAKQKIKETGCDGIMLGRAIFGNPWLFGFSGHFSGHSVSTKVSTGEETISLKTKLQVMVEHTKLFEKMLGRHKNFAIMKKHFKAYVNGFDGAKELRVKLMETENSEQVERVISEFLGVLDF